MIIQPKIHFCEFDVLQFTLLKVKCKDKYRFWIRSFNVYMCQLRRCFPVINSIKTGRVDRMYGNVHAIHPLRPPRRSARDVLTQTSLFLLDNNEIGIGKFTIYYIQRKIFNNFGNSKINEQYCLSLTLRLAKLQSTFD